MKYQGFVFYRLWILPHYDNYYDVVPSCRPE
jgi:hypothetical protein